MSAFVCLLVAATAWHAAGRPLSLFEYQFLCNLSKKHVATLERLDLKALAPGDWELVCDARGYGGEFYLEKYGRTYPAVGDLQDGAWGLVFIEPSGSFSSAAGTCASSEVVISMDRCAPPAEAVLQRRTESRGCPTFGNRLEGTASQK